MSISVAGSCVSATGWCVAAFRVSISSISKSVVGSCVSATEVGIGEDPGVWEVEDVWGISRIGGVSRVVIIKGGLIEALVRFLRKGGNGAICFHFRGGIS